jgi:hypothetical protein
MPENLVDPINLMLKDVTVGLYRSIPIPPCPVELPFMVLGWDGAGKDPDTYAGRAASCYYVMATSIPIFIQKLGRVPHWVATPRLLVQPAAFYGINANYDRHALNFGFAWDAPRNKIVYAAGAIDVVAHELGHAFLDIIRPEMWNYPLVEVGAMHESFADIHGILAVMRQDMILDKAIHENDNNSMMQSNSLSKIGIELGTAMYKLGPGDTKPLRDAVNFFKCVNSYTLPKTAHEDFLCAEVHNLSRLFTGTIWQVLAHIYSRNYINGQDLLTALRNASDTIMTYMVKSAQMVMVGAPMFQNWANALVLVDKQSGSPYAEEIAKVLNDRMFSVPMALANVHEVEVERDFELVKPKSLVPKDTVSVQNDNPLMDVQVHYPLDVAKHFDEHGNLLHKSKPDKDQTDLAILQFIDHIHTTDKVGLGREFRVENNVLLRNHTNCYCS